MMYRLALAKSSNGRENLTRRSSFAELLEGQAQFWTTFARALLSPTLPVFFSGSLKTVTLLLRLNFLYQ